MTFKQLRTMSYRSELVSMDASSSFSLSTCQCIRFSIIQCNLEKKDLPNEAHLSVKHTWFCPISVKYYL